MRYPLDPFKASIVSPTAGLKSGQFDRRRNLLRRSSYASRERIYSSKLCSSLFIKIDIAQRHQYSTFDVGRSMFDVQSVHCCTQWVKETNPNNGV